MRKKWIDEQMRTAMKVVEYGSSAINQVAMTHGVHKTTMNDRLSGHVEHGSKPGIKRYFNDEKVKISTFLQRCSSMGFGKTKHDVLNIA